MNDSGHSPDRSIADLLRKLPTPPPSEAFFPLLMENLARSDTTVERERPVQSRRSADGRMMAAVTALLTLALALPSGFVLGASVSADTGDDPVNDVTSFVPGNGWNTVTTTFGPAGQKLSVAWAANVPFADERDLSAFPRATVETLPETGIAMVAIGPRVYTGTTPFPELDGPLSLSQGSCAWDEYEGQPAPTVSRCMIDVMVRGRLLNVIVWFGSTDPSEEMIAAANAQLRSLTI
jgi:hypothetical protein